MEIVASVVACAALAPTALAAAFPHDGLAEPHGGLLRRAPTMCTSAWNAHAHADTQVSYIVTGDINGDGAADLVGFAGGGWTDRNFPGSQTTSPGSFPGQNGVALGALFGAAKDYIVTGYNGGLAVIDDSTPNTPLAQVAVPVNALVRPIAIADFNGDGFLDVVVCSGNKVTIVNGGAGPSAFAVSGSFPVGNNPNNVAAGDFNGDGIPDIVVFTDSGAQLLLVDSSGNARPPVSINVPGTWLVAGDLNNDGTADLVAVDSANGNVNAYLGGPSGFTLASQTAIPTVNGVVLGDVNGDGILDFIATSQSGSFLYLGDGQGNFVSTPLPLVPQADAVGGGVDQTTAGGFPFFGSFLGNGVPGYGLGTNHGVFWWDSTCGTAQSSSSSSSSASSTSSTSSTAAGTVTVTVTVTQPGGTATITQPGSTVTVTQPGGTATITQPGSTVTVTQAGSTKTVTATSTVTKTVTRTQTTAGPTVTKTVTKTVTTAVTKTATKTVTKTVTTA